MKKNDMHIKQAWFTIIRIKIKEHPGASLFINMLFLLPIPIFMFKIIISLIPNRVFIDIPITKQDIKRLIGAKGILVDVKTHNEDRIFIKNI